MEFSRGHLRPLLAHLSNWSGPAESLRRDLHRKPQLSGQESATLETVLAALPEGGQVTAVADTGAVVRFGGAGPAVGLRGEMDALPITEETPVPWASTHDGVMHACGHDVHMAAVVQVAHAAHALGFPRPLVVVLQPREEIYPSGAQDIALSKVLEDLECQAMIGAHVQPTLSSGTVSCTPGAVNASSDEFALTIFGQEGHAAYPHQTSDPVLAMAESILSLQSVVSRSVDPMIPAVLGVSSCAAGSAANVVPGDARATGTIRALSQSGRALMMDRMRNIVTHVAQAHQCRAQVVFTVGEPLLHNDPELAELVGTELQELGLSIDVTLRSLGADDFSFFAEEVPSLMMFVGTESDVSLHSSRFLPTTIDLRHVAQAMACGYVGASELLNHEAGVHDRSE